MKTCVTVVLFILSSISLFSQEDTINGKQLEEVVVTGQYRPQSIKRSVYQVKIVTGDRIRRQGATKLQDVLNTELNIRFSQDLATGGSDINMLGLSGQNVKILIDGLPMTGRQGTSNEININQVDVNSIERIEIVEGPMSVIYGADALGGVINIITKRNSKHKYFVNARLQEETVGNEYGIKQGIHNQNISAGWNKGNWELGGAFTRNYFGGWKDTATERELVWHKKDQLIANGYIGYRKNGFSIRYRIDGLDEIITNPGNFVNYQQDADDSLAFDQEYLTKRVMQQLQASSQLNKKWSLQSQAAYTDYSRQVFSTTVSKKTGDVRLNMGPGFQSMIDFTGFTFRGAAVYVVSKELTLQPGVEINTETGNGERLKEGVNRVNDYAFFLTGEYSPTSFISIRPGIRIVHNSVYDAPPVVPSLNAKISFAKDLILRLSYASGFRAPSIRELYFNFFDANHQIIGNPDLKAETSNSFTGSLSWRTDKVVTLTLNVFYNDIKNKIDYGVSASDPNIFIYANIAEYKTRGANLAANYKKKNLDVSAGIGYTGRYNELSVYDETVNDFNWSAELNSIIAYSFPKAGFDINFYYKFTGKQPFYQFSTVNGQQQLVQLETEGYHWADFSLNKKLTKLITISAGARNLFDVTRLNNNATTGVHTGNGTRQVGYGRSFFAGLNFNWNN